MFKDNCLCYSTGFEIMLLGSFNIITRVRFKMNSKLVLLGRSLSLNSSLDHHFWSVQSLLCIFFFYVYLNLVLPITLLTYTKLRQLLLSIYF